MLYCMSELTWSFKQVLVTADEADDEADDGYSAIVTTVPAPTQSADAVFTMFREQNLVEHNGCVDTESIPKLCHCY